MGAIVIKADARSKKLIQELAEKLGADVSSMNAEQYEDFLLGNLMETEKTGKTVSKATILKKLKTK